MQLRGQGVAILMVTHDLLGAADVADRMGFIAGGRLVEEVAASGEERFDVRALHRHYAGVGTDAHTGTGTDTHIEADTQGAAA